MIIRLFHMTLLPMGCYPKLDAFYKMIGRDCTGEVKVLMHIKTKMQAETIWIWQLCLFETSTIISIQSSIFHYPPLVATDDHPDEVKKRIKQSFFFLPREAHLVFAE